jgi:hypothetical protein
VGETTTQIKRRIGQQRDQLEAEVEQLQSQVRSMFNWREQVERHPWGAAATVFVAAYWAGRRVVRVIRKF